MCHIISIHSFKRGTGKSNLAANVAMLLALKGQRVGVIDTDIYAPTLHFLFGFRESATAHTLNDYLCGRCSIEQATHEITFPDISQGHLYLAPASTDMDKIAWALRRGCDIDLLNAGISSLIKSLNLDTAVIDTSAGLNEETLFAMAIASQVIILLRPNQQDYQGTAVMVDVARKLDVSKISLVINEMPLIFDEQAIKAQVEDTFECPVIATLPHCDELTALASAQIFVRRYPKHSFTDRLKQIVASHHL